MWTIVKRELLDHLVTLRFSALFALTFLLMTMTVLVFSGDYARRMREYPRRVEGFVDDDGRVHLGWIACQGVGVRAVPSPLAFLSAVVVHVTWELSRLEMRTRTLAEDVALLRAAVSRGTPAGAGTPPGDVTE